MSIEATLAFRQDNIGAVGRERIALLEAVGRDGSISAAARSQGLSYKAAWDALDAMQNLVAKPLITKSVGGRCGGHSSLTDAGLQLIETFHRLESGLATMLSDAAKDLEAIGLSQTGLLQGFMMKTSARNVLAGVVESVNADMLAAEVAIRILPDVIIRSKITVKSAEALGLVKGRHVAALIKAPFLMVQARNVQTNHDDENILNGILRTITLGPTSAEIVVDIGQEKTLVATIAVGAADDVALKTLKPDAPVIVSFKAENVIIATS